MDYSFGYCGLKEQAFRLHTTELGAERIAKNLGFRGVDAVAHCRQLIFSNDAKIMRRGQNYNVEAGGCTLTINAASLTIITAKPSAIGEKYEIKNHRHM